MKPHLTPLPGPFEPRALVEMTRRDFLASSTSGLGLAALATLLRGQGLLAQDAATRSSRNATAAGSHSDSPTTTRKAAAS